MKLPEVDSLLKGLLAGERAMLGRAITLVESQLANHQQLAAQLLEAALPHTGKAWRIGITGVPGVGKSTFIDAFGSLLTAAGHRVAVLAIDPSSSRTGGSILGDKTRMERLAYDDRAFIRPTAAGSALGGVARASWEAMILCEAAGYDMILIETVGVGQSETAVAGLVDFFVLLMLSGAGDELQGIKRGIMEMADLLLINKAEGDNLNPAKMAAANYRNALHLFPPHPASWTPLVQLCSAQDGSGLEDVWHSVQRFFDLTASNGHLQQQRARQRIKHFRDFTRQRLEQRLLNSPQQQALARELEKQVATGSMSPYAATEALIHGLDL
ncbi:MAG: methylmalonyl Co-A mutase-associated GTPase MeaB [Bacteroidia bacterium]